MRLFLRFSNTVELSGLNGSLLQDDLGTLSDAKTFGEVVVGLYNEDILPDYTIRTMKVFINLSKTRTCNHDVSYIGSS